MCVCVVSLFPDAAGDFSMTDLQMIFHTIDTKCKNRLSQARYIKDQRRWAKDDFQQQLVDDWSASDNL